MNKLKTFISTIGRRRFISLVILIAVNTALGGFWYQILLPKNESLTNESAGIKNDRMRLQQEINELPGKYQLLKDNEAKYNDVNNKGFFSLQDRINARSTMDRLRTEAGVRGISYNIQPQEPVENPQNFSTGSDIVKSKITVDMKGLSDLEMRDFIQKMGEKFSGLVVARSFAFETDEPITEENLMKLGNKIPVDFVKSKVDFEWYSMIPKKPDPNAPASDAFVGGMQ